MTFIVYLFNFDKRGFVLYIVLGQLVNVIDEIS